METASRDVVQRLVKARLGEGLAARPVAPFSLDEAYAIQSETLAAPGESLGGYKVGLTTSAAQHAMGTSEPIAGGLRSRDFMQSPVRIDSVSYQRFAEAELIVEIGEDFPVGSAPLSESDIARRISGLFAGIELCASRYDDDDVTVAQLVADNSNAELLIVGSRLAPGWDERFSDIPVNLYCKGRDPVRGSTAAVLGNPLRSVTWLANWLARRGQRLTRGQLVASGSATGITDLESEEEILADFGGLGSVSVIIARAPLKGRDE